MYGDDDFYDDEYYSEEEELAAERDLASDAQWKMIQKNTFTRWCNEHLKSSNKSVTDLEFDFSDGLNLISLVEALAGKKFKRVNRRPNFRSQKLENVTNVMTFLEEEEGIKLVNIDSTDVIDSKLKLILGLIWTLILHYSITMPLWDDEPMYGGPGTKEGPTPKQRLLIWVQNKVPEVPIKNFTTDWNDGKAIGALVDAVGPGLCPGWEDWDPKQAKRNATEAMDIAEKWLDVPQLIRPEDMVNPRIDEQSMMTYLSQFPNAKLKAGAPVKGQPKSNASRVKAYGPGLEPRGNIVGKPAKFIIETFAAGKGEPKVFLKNPAGQPEPCEMVFNNDRNLTYSCQYIPTMEGEYTVTIQFNGQEIPKSPYKVMVEGAAGDPNQVTAAGPGLAEFGLQAGKKTYFEVYTEAAFITLPAGAGTGNVEIFILDPHGQRDTTRPRIAKSTDTTYYVEYLPKEVGRYTVMIYFAGTEIPTSPYPVNVGAPCDPSKAYATGRGIQPRGIRVGDLAPIKVHTENAGDGDVAGILQGPVSEDAKKPGTEEPLRFKKIDPSTYETSYVPKTAGLYNVNLMYGGNHIQKSPFKVNVGPFKESNIRAYGPGLEGGLCNKPADFVVETNGETGALGFAIEGPSQAKIDCADKGDGSADVSYLPTAPGEYAVHVLCDNEDIPKSPFMAQIEPATRDYNPLQVTAFGPGLEKHGNIVNKWAQFTVDTRKAGMAPLKLYCEDAQARRVDIQCRDNRDGTYSCQYLPKHAIKHTIIISYGGVNIPKSPYRVYVEEPSRPENVRVYGPGIDGPVKTFEPTYFFVDCSEAGPGDVAISLCDERGLDVPVDAADNGEGLFRIDYTPKSVGVYTANVIFAEQEIPTSPYRINVQPNIDLSKVKVTGLEPRVFMDSNTDFIVDAASVAPDCKGKVRAIITSPSGNKNDSLVTPNGDGTYSVSYAPYEQGPHTIDVTYENLPIPQSPFNVNVSPGCDPSRVKAYGPGLEGGLTNVPATFTIETKGAGQGSLSLAVEGPSKADVTCKDNHDGTCTVDYIPTKPGEYDIKVNFADQPIPGSPYKVPIKDKVDASKCRMYGPGLNPEGVRATLPATFTVDATQAGKAPLEVTYDDSKTKRPVETRQVQPGVYQCTYYPAEEGVCTLDVKHGGQHIPASPHKQKVLPSFDPSKVRVTGPGVENGCPASIPTAFVIDTTDAGDAELDVAIQAPDNTYLRPNIIDNRDATVTVNYSPEECGVYTVKVKYGGKEIPKSPISVHTRPSGDASKCILIDAKRRVIVNEECVINVDRSRAGPGNVSCKIKAPDGRNTDVQVDDNQNGTVSIYYTPRMSGNYHVVIKYGGMEIPEGNFVVEADIVKVDSVDTSRPPALNMFHPVDFVIPTGPQFNFTTARITTPSGRTDLPDIVDNGDGSVTIKYQPIETGLHNLHVAYNNKPLEGSPYQFYVDAVDSGVVAAYGPGLSYGVAGEPCSFTIDTKNAGAGGLSLAVEGPSKAEISCLDNHDGTCTVTFVPKVAGEYRASVKVNGQHIPGSPYLVKVQPRPGEVTERSQYSMGTASEFSLSVREYEISELTADITTPSGRAEPCVLKKLPNGHLGISFTPHETGTHLVNVYRKGQHIPGSPFKIDVSRNEVGDASRVRVYGEGLYRGQVNQINEFVVDTRDAGYGGLSLAIEGPSKADIDCKDRPDGTCLVSYKPTQAGTYCIAIKFAEEHVPGSPFNCKIGGISKTREESIISRTQAVVETTHVGSICELSLKLPGSDPMEMVSSVTSPSGVTELCDIVDQRDDHYTIKFTPQEMGVHTVCIKHKGLHVPGSPFQFTVGPIIEGGAHKVHANGPGLERGEVGEPNEFNIFTREAGAGAICVSIEGPSKPTIAFEDKFTGSSVVAYKCSEPGEYMLSVKFNDEHVPDSPFRVPVRPSTGDARKLTVQSLKQRGLEIGKPVAFSCVFNGAKGHLGARVVSPSGAEDEALIQALDDTNGHYAVRFIPRENGIHYIHLTLDDNHIVGSPFRAIVGEADPDPGLITANGEGLVKGATGQDNRFIVNTLGSAPSTLAVTIDGPTKSQINAKEVDTGYEFDWKPSAPGNYYLTIKYGGNCHIAGSPFKAVVTGSGKATGKHEHAHCVVETVKKAENTGPAMPKFNSDASKCVSKGLGLNKAFVNRTAQFTVDVSQAGKNLIFVGLVGPANAAPVDEIVIKAGARNTYNCSYTVKQKGKYLLLVRYGEQNIPGSPFQINVV